MVLSPQLGQIAAKLGGWSGTRIAQDDIWMKPPHHGKEISYHTDCAYIPWKEVTVWVALDDVSASSGTLEYIKGSHRWSKLPEDSHITGEFHAPDASYTRPLHAEASARNLSLSDLKDLTIKVEVPAGGCSFHDGNLWHGSGINTSNHWRRSIGIHLIPSDASFEGKNVGYIYGRYRIHNSIEMHER